MSDAATAHHAGLAARNGAAGGALSLEAIDRILADFRAWLEAHGTEPVETAGERLDLAALVAQFTALRHEVNLQTKASRALTEQTTKLLETTGGSEVPKPAVKALFDLADVLAVSKMQMEKLRETVEPLLESLACEPLPPTPAGSPGFLSRMLGASNREWTAWAAAERSQHDAHAEVSAEAASTLLDLAKAAADGYAMSLRRAERAFPDFGLEPIDCLGRPFDPETMEVVEVGGQGGANIVIGEIRRGYRCNGRVIRYAQVRVAR
jgi:molecular chaperone GrpE